MRGPSQVRLAERFLLGIAIGSLPPIVGLLAGWWGTVGLLPDQGVAVAAFAGLAAGIVLDLLFLRRWMARAQAAPLWTWAAVYLVYSVGAFGFFMGVPVGIPLLALPAGILYGGRLAGRATPPDHVRREARRAASFTTAVLAIACSASAALALRDPYTAGNLEGMLRLPFHVTPMMILSLILIGGAGLLLAQWVLTRAAVRWAHARLTPAP